MKLKITCSSIMMKCFFLSKQKFEIYKNDYKNSFSVRKITQYIISTASFCSFFVQP